MTPRSDTDVCLDQLSAQLQQLQHTTRMWRLGLLAAVAGLALTLWLRPGPQPGSPVLIRQSGDRVLLTVDDVGTPMLRLESRQAFAQLAVRTDGMAVLLLWGRQA